MAFAQLRIFSEALRRATTVNVVIPQRSTSGEIGTENKTEKVRPWKNKQGARIVVKGSGSTDS